MLLLYSVSCPQCEEPVERYVFSGVEEPDDLKTFFITVIDANAEFLSIADPKLIFFWMQLVATIICYQFSFPQSAFVSAFTTFVNLVRAKVSMDLVTKILLDINLAALTIMTGVLAYQGF